MLERLNGEDGLGAIFPAMVNALEVMVLLGVSEAEDPRRVTAKRAIEKLLVHRARRAPTASPASRRSGTRPLASARHAGEPAITQAHRSAPRRAALDWLKTKQLLDEPGDWRVTRHRGARRWLGLPVQQHTTTRTWTTPRWWPGPCIRRAMPPDYATSNVRRALDWLVGDAERGWRLRRLRCRQHPLLLNKIPFADHGACSIRPPAT